MGARRARPRLAENGNGSAGALRLFVERATQVEQGFSLDDDERAEAHRICRLVEGLPLGIELAASWVSVLPCAGSRTRSSGTSISSPRRCAMSRSGIAASAPPSTSRGGCSPASNRMSSRDSRCSEAATDVRQRPRFLAPTCACFPSWCRNRSCDARTGRRAARAAAPVRGRAAGRVARRGTRRTRAARTSLRGHADGAAGGADGRSSAAPTNYGASWTTFALRRQWTWPRTTSTWRCRCWEPSTRSCGCTAGSTGPRRSSGSRARPASTPTSPEARRRRADGGDVLGRHRRPTRARPGRRGARRALLPVLRARNLQQSSQAACARWASWRCIGTSTRRRWRSRRGAEIARGDRRRAHGERRSDGSRFRSTPAG